MKNKDIIVLSQALQLVGNLTGIKFVYGVVKNMNILKPEIELLQKTIEASDKFIEYDTKRIELAKKYSSKDEKGNPMVQENEFVISDRAGFDKEIEKLKKEYKKVLDIREEQLKQYRELLEENADIKLHMINFEDVPVNITSAQLSGIFCLIKEEKIEKAKK